MHFTCEKDMDLEGTRWWTIMGSIVSFQNSHEILVLKYLRMLPYYK